MTSPSQDGSLRTASRVIATPWVIVGLVAAGAVLRVLVAGQDLYADELATYWVATAHDLGGVLETVASTAEITPPLSFLLTWLTTQVGQQPVERLLRRHAAADRRAAQGLQPAAVEQDLQRGAVGQRKHGPAEILGRNVESEALLLRCRHGRALGLRGGGRQAQTDGQGQRADGQTQQATAIEARQLGPHRQFRIHA